MKVVTLSNRSLSVIAGTSYLGIFFLAIYANFFMLEGLIDHPMDTLVERATHVRLGVIAFLMVVALDVVVAWALKLLYPDHPFTDLSTYFRLMHAAIMGVAVFALAQTLKATGEQEVLSLVDTFNTIWLLGLFFFGIHLVLLARILNRPRIITVLLIVAGAMYMADTIAHFVLSDYESYAGVFLAMVAVPSILGELSLAVWLLLKGGK